MLERARLKLGANFRRGPRALGLFWPPIRFCDYRLFRGSSFFPVPMLLFFPEISALASYISENARAANVSRDFGISSSFGPETGDPGLWPGLEKTSGIY
jgi:hypothetical protein